MASKCTFFLPSSSSLKPLHWSNQTISYLSIHPNKLHTLLSEQFGPDPTLLFLASSHLNPLLTWFYSLGLSLFSSLPPTPPDLLFFHDSACPYFSSLIYSQGNLYTWPSSTQIPRAWDLLTHSSSLRFFYISTDKCGLKRVTFPLTMHTKLRVRGLPEWLDHVMKSIPELVSGLLLLPSPYRLCFLLVLSWETPCQPTWPSACLLCISDAD